MKSVEITIENEVGLHARPAALFVQTAGKYQSEISVYCEGRSANAKSILAVMTLGAENGSVIKIAADGQDEDQAIDALVDLVSSKFGDVE